MEGVRIVSLVLAEFQVFFLAEISFNTNASAKLKPGVRRMSQRLQGILILSVYMC